MGNVSNPSLSSDAGRWRLDWDATVRRMRLLTDLALALVELGRASRVLVEGNGQVVLTLCSSRGPVGVLAVHDAGGWAYIWGASQRYSADAGLAELRRAASVLAEVER
ncbi:hypothetical protein [Actinomadura sp. 9N407]|uniref:hypothetical protein n=1 Tax=Actinomadura sp. 9N407 TaxID=3375154 RepID=UPI0037B80B19